ncbi:MAG: hypothetical protein R2695_21490 [Acidimicrobiales bacterium]
MLVHPGSIITTNVRVGRHTHVNAGAIISHDCRIGEFVTVSPGVRLNGDVTIADDAFIGTWVRSCCPVEPSVRLRSSGRVPS